MSGELREKLKKTFNKMTELKVLIVILIVGGLLSYYTKTYCKTNILGIEDTKIIMGLICISIWSVGYSIKFMTMINEKQDIILQNLDTIKTQNNIIDGKNDVIINLATQIKEQNNNIIKSNSNIEETTKNIKEDTEEILEQNDYIVEKQIDNYDNLVKFHKQDRIFLNRIGGEKLA